MVSLGMTASIFDALSPLFNRYALDHFVADNTLDGLGVFIALYVGLLVVYMLDNFATTYLCGKTEMSVNRDLRNAAFSHLQELSFSYYNRNNVGYIHARVMSDTEKIGVLVAWRLMDMIWNGSYVVFVIVEMFVLDARLALYVCALVPVVALLVAYFQKKLIKENRYIRELNSAITGDLNEGITGARSVKALLAEERMKSILGRHTKEMEKRSVKAARHSSFFTAAVSMMSTFALAIVLFRGGILSQDGVMKLGTLSVFLTCALGMLEPVQFMVVTFSEIIAVQVNIERLTKLLETEADVSDTKEVIEKYGDSFAPKRENWEELQGEVEFQDVSFHYPDGDEYVLEHFNLKVEKGMNVAIVGETGAGKSTLVNLVCRFFEPTSGRVLIDGRDARERSQIWLHSNIGYMLQTPHLFSGSIRDNLRYGKADATDEEILEALKLVSADGIVKRAEKGLDTEAGEGGDSLSTGEKQLLSFARALLADPKILVLDEATASIDTVTEKAIQKAIATVTKNRTSFVIAHRLSTITVADLIHMVHDGKITERGTHRELMEKRGAYYRLFSRQYEELAYEE
ncbi:MAG: ABC transporter ATP-binding protein [Lachnospiraceae bacterium]|nr:ABC transporter ATP-binding protein [Lachnospiraceae bacterium]